MRAERPISKVGFVGVGRMGWPVCRNLMDSGYEVFGYRRGSLEEFTEAGGVAVTSPEEVAALSEIVFCCMPSDDALHEILCGSAGIMKALKPGQIVVEFGSHSVPFKEKYVGVLAQKKAKFLDGEISGTPGMVVARRAAVYLSGDRDAADVAATVVSGFADACFYLGAFGAASKVKLINNFLVALHILGAAQAMSVGIKTGIDLASMIKAINQGSGGSTQFGLRAPVMASRSFDEQSGPADGLLHYCERMRGLATEVGAKTHLIDTVVDGLRNALSVIGDRDVAAILETFE
jgi:3-hydroxyisobutyrate dehydrogenase-like beta-hydroxyacid dehydrogenase